MSNLIDRQQAIEAICMETCGVSLKNERCMVHCTEVQAVEKLPPAEPMVDIRDTQYNLPVGTDTISRAKAIEAIDEIESEIAEGFGFEYEKWRKYFCDLPPAQPDVPDINVGDMISRAKAIEALDKRFDSIPMEQTSEILMLRKDLRELPPAQPKRGRWIYKNDLMTVPTGYWECSECKEGRLLYEENFCPNCGADMREVTE